MNTCNECKYMTRAYTGSVITTEVIDVSFICVLNNFQLPNQYVKTHNCKHFDNCEKLTTNYLIKQNIGYKEVK